MGGVIAEPVPAWLAAWRAGQEPVTLCEQPVAPAPRPATTIAPAQAAPAKRYTNPTGYSYPQPWQFDGGLRREPVLDLDCHPPRVVRRVGWQRCMRCRQPFWSDDVIRLRLCSSGTGCREDEDRFAQGEPGGLYSRYRD